MGSRVMANVVLVFLVRLSVILRSTNGADTSLESSMMSDLSLGIPDSVTATQAIHDSELSLQSQPPLDPPPYPVTEQVAIDTTSSQTESLSSGETVDSTSQEEIRQEPSESSSVGGIQESHGTIASTDVVQESMTKLPEPPPDIDMPQQPDERMTHNVPLPELKLTNDQPADSQPTDTEVANATAPLEQEENFATFEEWSAQKRAEQEKSKQEQEELGVIQQNGAVVSKATKVSRNNYASGECGSKILATNPEMENSRSVLNDNKDEYMINPCSAKNWFVVELCEPIQIQSLELASFELFSSQPHHFTVYLSDWYPPKEWRVLASFEASVDRGIQSFQIQDDIFVKYVKVEMVDHYGEEHYCPLSLFRVYGVALADDDDDDHAQKSDEVTTSDEANADAPSNLFESAKDTVLSLVKKVLKVDESNTTAEVPNNNITADAVKPNISEDGTILPCVPGVTIAPVGGVVEPSSTIVESSQSQISPQPPSPSPTERSIVTKLEDHEQPPSSQSDILSKSHGLLSLRALATTCCSCDRLANQPSAVTKTTRVVCLYFRLILGGSTKSSCIRVLKPDEIVKLDEELDAELSRKSSAEHIVADQNLVTPVKDQISATKVLDPKLTDVSTRGVTHTVSSNEKSPGSGDSHVVSSAEERSDPDDQSVAAAKGDDKPCTSRGIMDLEPSSKTCGFLARSEKMSDLNRESLLTVESSYSPVAVQSSVISLTSFSHESATPGLSQSSVSKPAPPLATVETETTQMTDAHDMIQTSEVFVAMATETPIVVATDVSSAVVPSDAKNPELKVVKPGQSDEKASTFVRVPVNAVSKRETQIMRLSNRIKALELNVSLSSRFLEELSQRYRKKSEDLMKMLNSTTSKLLNASKIGSLKEQSQQMSMRQLESRVDDLAESLTQLSHTIGALRTEINERHFLWGITEVIVVTILFLLIIHKRRPVIHQPSAAAPATRPVHRPTQPVTPSRHQRNLSADSAISKQSSSLTPQKRQASVGCIDTLDYDFHIVQPTQSFFTHFGKPPDGLKRKKKKRNKQILTSSHSDLADLAYKFPVDKAVEPTPHVDTLQSEFSSAGLLFAADTNYKPNTPEKGVVSAVKRNKSLSQIANARAEKSLHDTTLRRCNSNNGCRKPGVPMRGVNSGGSHKDILSAIRPCNLEILPPLRLTHGKVVYRDKIRPVIRA